MKEKVLFYTRKFVIFIIALMSLLTLCFTYLYVKSTAINIDGANQINLSGFNFLSFPAKSVKITNYSSITLSNSFCLTILIVSIMLIILSIFNVFIKGKSADLIIVVLALFLAAYYASMAISTLALYLHIFAENETGYTMSTAAYVPLIIQAVLTCAYCIFLFFENRLANPTAFVKKKKSASTTSYIEDLKQLKELFDAQIINQEEFDAKKKEILGL